MSQSLSSKPNPIGHLSLFLISRQRNNFQQISDGPQYSSAKAREKISSCLDSKIDDVLLANGVPPWFTVFLLSFTDASLCSG